jgi:rubrerythrin
MGKEKKKSVRRKSYKITTKKKELLDTGASAQCQYCGASIDGTSIYCPYCGGVREVEI